MESTAAPPPAQAPAPAPAPAAERLSAGVQQQLNLESVKARAVGLYKAISRILEDFDMYSRTNASPKWQEALGQFSMVSMELFNIVEDIKKVSKAFVVYPRNVNAQNATILPVMLSSKLLPEMETEDNAKRELLLNAITKNPIHNQIEKLKMRIDMIGAACEAAEKVIAECRKMHGLGSRQGIHLAPTLDKAQAAKIQEQENSLRAAINYGEGLRIQGDQRQMLTSLPSHLVEVLGSADGTQNNFGDNSAGVYPKGAPMQQVPGSQLAGGRSVPSPAGPTFENVSTPPMPPYANNANNNTMNNNNNTNSPRSGANLMNNNNNMAASPQQLQHQRQQKIMQQVNQHQQMRVGANQQPVLGQGTIPQLHDLQGQTQQKLHQVQGQMQYPQPTLAQQYQNRNMQSALNMQQQTMVQNNQLRSHLGQFSGTGNNPLYGTAQASPTSQMLTNMSATIQPRMQFGLTQRNLPSQILNDQMFGMGPGNGNAGGTMVGIPQQQGMFSNMNTNPQNMQQGMMGMQQNPNLSQQRSQNQQ